MQHSYFFLSRPENAGSFQVRGKISTRFREIQRFLKTGNWVTRISEVSRDFRSHFPRFQKSSSGTSETNQSQASIQIWALDCSRRVSARTTLKEVGCGMCGRENSRSSATAAQIFTRRFQCWRGALFSATRVVVRGVFGRRFVVTVLEDLVKRGRLISKSL